MSSQFNILSRRKFIGTSFKAGMGAAIASLVDIPFVMKRALAEGSIGLNGKKVLFIWLRFGNDSLNSVIPIMDPQYAINRPDIKIPADGGTNYGTPGGCDFPIGNSTLATYHYANAIRLGNGFAALHPSLKFLAPVYNAGDLAIVHRVGYPKQSRSHFDSQNYWENGNPNKNLVKDGIFYRTLLESGLANTSPLTGVSVQSSLPLILRGSQAAMTNLTDPNRYDLLGVPTPGGDPKASAALAAANSYPFTPKQNREMLALQYQNMSRTLDIFAGIDFDENYVNAASPGNYYRDTEQTDGDVDWFNAANNNPINPADANRGYYLFPTTDAKNGGYRRPDGSLLAAKQLVPTGAYSFFKNLKAAAMILNKTDAIIAGTEIGGFDTHQNQGAATGSHANLQRSIGWAMYALRKYFTQYSDRVNWDNVVVVTLSEFGRTSVENSDNGTDHAEAGAMFVAGGLVKGYGAGNTTGVFGISPAPAEAIPWLTGGPSVNTMFAANPGVSAGYLRRSCDYRSVLGEIIRKHLGATQGQLERIIPGYAVPGEFLAAGGTSSIDGTPIRGEVGIL